MADQELDQLRQQRMAQLESQHGGNNKDAGEQQKIQQDRVRQQEDAKNSILSQIMDQDARARLNTLKISKPEKAQMVEGMICRMAQMGQLPGKLDDAQFIQLLESVNSQMPRSTSSVKFDRRRAAIDSDDDEDYGL